MKAANLALKFLLELAAIAAFAVWGATVGSGAVSVLVAVAAPLLMIVLWGSLAAPKASRRLRATARIPFELGVFALATVALFAATSDLVAVLFAAAVIINAALLTLFGQWES